MRLYVHRIAWLMVYNDWPTDVIDHINGDRSDNRIANL
ncbi:HNH endonuclease, partial [Escherichia coli]|nr:HNH endonuclease [Escherichia coli]